MPIDPRFDPNEIPLMTDLYELTMAASYFALGFNRPARFGMSGDLTDLSHKARAILDRNGLKNISIFASENLNEYKIHDLLAANAPIDAFSVGADRSSAPTPRRSTWPTN